MNNPMFLAAAAETASTLSSVVTKEMVGGVFNEIVSLLPVLIPVSVGFIAVRKGLGFLFGTLRQA
ncbi:MAG: hypothetical protein NC251_13465 [Lachnoclostridium sp.]|nr:hypothetical protein [Lachnospira sp.]MCM1249419.1 hypothetical protein [Lachnoclostridium sp.]